MEENKKCDNPHCEDGIVDRCPYYGTPIYCQVCNKYLEK